LALDKATGAVYAEGGKDGHACVVRTEEPMTEAEWLTATDPREMLPFLRDRASERKVRLYACAGAYLVWDRLADERSRLAVLTAERFADSQADLVELMRAFNAAQQAWNEIPVVWGNRRVAGNKALTGTRAALRAAAVARNAANPEWDLQRAVWATLTDKGARKYALANLLRDILGNPFRDVAVDQAVLTWNGGTVPRLAHAAYEERPLPAGPLDAARLGMLADALEDAGCADADLVGHLRGEGPHFRGCWVVDLLTARS
jgi:hypothetical protein